MTFIPVGIIGIVFLFLIYDSIKQVEALRSLEKNSAEIISISNLITYLQQERGLSSGYLSSHGAKFSEELSKVRDKVDYDYKKLDLNVTVIELRKRIDAMRISTVEAFAIYTGIIKNFQMQYLSTVEKINDPSLVKELHTYINLSFMKEALGEIRGTLNGVFAAKNVPDRKLLYNMARARGMYEVSFEQFHATAPKRFLNWIHTVISSEKYKTIEHTVEKYAFFHIDEPNEDPKRWFRICTDVIDEIAQMEKAFILMVGKSIQHKVESIESKIVSQLLFLFVIALFILWLGYQLKHGVLRNITLLQQYKNAVDRSSIVSKTDKGGRITYANDKFCEISGYAKEELVGKPHNIVRHPDVPKAVFKEMWETILAKKAWNGIVKNRKKNGDYYIVEATINPILDQNGKIEEFIAIRNDITEVVKLHEELEHTQEELIFRMGEIGERRSEETGCHVKRVAKYSELLAKYYGLDEEEIRHLFFASPMHDIGKVAIPDTILKKPGKLTNEEWKIMKTHTEIGYALFKNSQRPLLQTAAIIAYEHHEKWDGSGYPRGLKGEQIHIFGRITALADVFDALGSDRYYKKAWSDEKIFALIKEERGRHFDPVLVDIFFEHLDEFLYIRKAFSTQSDFMRE